MIQRLRDPVDGTICYLYLPISAPHSPVTSTGFVQYGPNAIGSINCMPGTPGAAPGRKQDLSGDEMAGIIIGQNGLFDFRCRQSMSVIGQQDYRADIPDVCAFTIRLNAPQRN